MVEVVSVKFKNRGKAYFFSPNGLDVKAGDKVVVETSKGLELADCSRGNHPVEETAVVLPLRPIVRIATQDDLRVEKINVVREKEAFEICQRKIHEHGLDMKLVDVECNFEGTKTMFFFTSDGRVDFRELVKDLAVIFRNRIELRQIGVRDEAKTLGGIGICGRPYCCSQFLDDFQPVSTKMAKIQSLSLNPAKISGSCDRLMCCLRYEQEAYEDLVKRVPKQGAFVETKDGFGTAVQVNLLRQSVKVKLDNDTDDSLRLYKANELCTVPGGRPKDGEAPVSTFKYVPEPEEEPEAEPSNGWDIPETPVVVLVTVEKQSAPAESAKAHNLRRKQKKAPTPAQTEGKPEAAHTAIVKPEPEQPAKEAHRKPHHSRSGGPNRSARPDKKKADAAHSKEANPKAEAVKPHAESAKPHTENVKPHAEKVPAEKRTAENAKPENADKPQRRPNHHRHYYHGKPKNKQQ